MDNTAIVAAWAAAIATVVGPIVAVGMAHWMAKQESNRRDTSLLFRQVTEDIHRFRFAFLAKLYAQSKAFDAVPDSVPAIGQGGKWLGSEASKSEYERKQDRLRQAIAYSNEMSQQLDSTIAILHADQMSLRLTFDKSSNKCVTTITELCDLVELLKRQPLPSYQECAEQLNSHLKSISGELTRLFDSLGEFDLASM